MKDCITLLFAMILFTACEQKHSINANGSSGKASLIDADKTFSKLSEAKGMKNAFIEYMDSNGILLKPGRLPIVAANAISYPAK